MKATPALFTAVVALFLGSSTVALAQQTAAPARGAGRAGFGAGAEYTLTGLLGGTFVYDAGTWHADVLLNSNFAHAQNQIGVAGRFFFVLHQSAAADFSIGPGIGFVHRHRENDDGSNPQDFNDIHVEGGLQIRAFVVSNVALSASAGIGAVFPSSPDHSSASIGGQAGASFGITYFFY
jgi:hypothetical protein